MIVLLIKKGINLARTKGANQIEPVGVRITPTISKENFLQLKKQKCSYGFYLNKLITADRQKDERDDFVCSP